MSQPVDNNPFVLPGLGQASGDLAGNPLFAGLEMMRRAWSSLAGANGLAQSLPMSPMLNIEELDKRLTELKSVESWLSLNLSMLSSSIQGLEVQRATLTTLRSFMDAASYGPDATPASRSPLEIVLGIRPGDGAPMHSGAAPSTAASQPVAAASSADRPSATPAVAGGESSVTAAAAAGEQVMQASQAWWNMMQQQFQQLAAATAAQASTGQPVGAADKPAVAAMANGPRSVKKPLTPQPGKPVAGTAAKTASTGQTPGARKTASPAKKASARQTSVASTPPARKN